MNTSSNLYIPRYQGAGCLLQILWFLIIGWWLGLITIALAWLLNITIIGLPLGLLILNNIPMIIALQSPKTVVVANQSHGTTSIHERGLRQYPFLVRAIYFLLIGWWWSLIWLLVAYVFCATLVLLPIGILMFRWTPLMTTLKQY